MCLPVLQLLQGPVSCIWHCSRVCVLFETEGTNWAGCSFLAVQVALWEVGRAHGVSRLVREKKERYLTFLAKQIFWSVAIRVTPVFWTLVQSFGSPRLGSECTREATAELRSHCLWEAGVTSGWEQAGEVCKGGRYP